MSNQVKDIDMKNRAYHFFGDIISVKNFDPYNIKIDEKSYKNIHIYYIGYMTIKDSKYVKINNLNLLHLILNKVNGLDGYLEEISGNKYLTLGPTNKNQEKIKKYEELWIKIRDLIMSITKNSDDYDGKHMKIKFNWDDELSLNKAIEIPTMAIVIRPIFYENSKYYPQLFLDGCLYKLQIK